MKGIKMAKVLLLWLFTTYVHNSSVHIILMLIDSNYRIFISRFAALFKF